MRNSITTIERPAALPVANAAYQAAQAQFDAAAERLGLDRACRDLLRSPMREHHFAVPMRLDDGTSRVFRGLRVQHNNALGPYKGGVRFHPASTADETRALAMWMTWKCALLELPLGGAAGAIACDPRRLSLGEQERLCRSWVRQVASAPGPNQDVPAPDVMTSSHHMLWMLDEFETIHGAKAPGMITGKPVGMGGSPGRTEATGHGVVVVLREALKRLGVTPAAVSASIQGFGKVAQHAARSLIAMGGTVVAVSSWHAGEQRAYTYRRSSGVHPDELAAITDPVGSIDMDRAIDLGYEVRPGSSWIEQEVDVLIPAALEDQITASNTNRVHGRVRLVIEAANGPTSTDACRILEDRGVVIVPDVLANAGGVTCSYFEQVQGTANFYWERAEVLARLDAWMTRAFEAVSARAERESVVLRDAAYLIAVDRAARASVERGWV